MKTVIIKRDVNSEYRVPAQNGCESGAYYTDDKEDAIGTATNFMYVGEQIKIVIRNVSSHS